MKNKIWGGFLLSTVAAISGTTMVNATSTQIRDNVDSPQSIVIYRKVEGVTNPVSNIFTYQITADENNPAAVGNLPSTTQVIFDAVMPDENNVASATALLDLSSVAFSKIGDYKFKIIESISDKADTYPVDSTHEYYLYSSVRNEVVNNRPTGNIIATLALQARDGDEGEKVDVVFSSKAKLTYIQINKEVTGNAARMDEYFKFLVTMNNAPVGDRYVISGQDATVVYNGETITTQNEFVAGQDNYIYLKHGQTVTIGISGDLRQIKGGTNYRFTEEVPEGYTVTANGVERNHSGFYHAVLPEPGTDELPIANKAFFVNHKESAVLTGISTAIVPMVSFGALTICGYIVFRRLHSGVE